MERPGGAGKGMVRALVRRGTRDTRSHAAERRHGHPADPTLCPHCGAVFARRCWRRGPRLSAARRRAAARAACPACLQARRGEGRGVVRLRGSFVPKHFQEIRSRIHNVAGRAAFTQPERRLVFLRKHGAEAEVLTTSQKLAHRIARELVKAFQGQATFSWTAPDGRLLAIWEREEAPPRAQRRRAGSAP